MDYLLKEFKVNDLVKLIDENKIDLNPAYQRNFIWSPNDQKELIDTILLGHPLPSFFIYQKDDDLYEMVDGQQRSKTIYRFVKGEISSSKNTNEKGYNEHNIDMYRLSIIMISNLKKEESLNDFYVLINKKGKHLNTPELYKSEFHDTNFLKLSNEMLSYQNFIDLDLFTAASKRRMNDRSYVEELLGYLILGVKDKKKFIENVYKKDIDNDKYLRLKEDFKAVIDIIYKFNEIKPVKDTRYKQKNDFYTLFSYVHRNKDLPIELLIYQYKILLILDGVDKEKRQFIRPTNDECLPLMEYANNCVTQSNSKRAREGRLEFFNEILKNKDTGENETLIDVLNYLIMQYSEDSINVIEVNEFELIDVKLINKDL